MNGRFIFICDSDNLLIAGTAVKYLQDRPDAKNVMISKGSEGNEVLMFAKRLKNSIRVRQVKP